jgi:hypothetical protein
MTVALPQGVATTSQWQIVDWLDRDWQSAPAAGGVAVLELPQLPENQRWQLTHAVIGCTSTSTTSLRFYLDQITGRGLRDGSDKGNFDVADWAMGLMVPPGRALVARWTGCSAGAVGTLALQANIYQRTA